MRLHGSCQCGKVRFSIDSDTPVPYQICFCSICRKTTGGLAGCNIMGKRATLKRKGKPSRYHAVMREEGRRARRSSAWRVFCGACGTHLWLEDPDYPDEIWPNAGAIDDPLPVPPVRTCIMLRFKPDWVPLPRGRILQKKVYPDQSIADWHLTHDRRRSGR